MKATQHGNDPHAEEAKSKIEKKLGQPLDFMVASPGRINLIGEHTDYNKGFSVPSAVNSYIYLGFSKMPEDEQCPFHIEIYSLDYNENA